MAEYGMQIGGALGGQGVQNYPAQVPKRNDNVNASLARANNVIDNLYKSASRVRATADGLDGPVPEKESNPMLSEGAVKPCLVGSVDHLVSRLHKLVAQIDSDISRIESALG